MPYTAPTFITAQEVKDCLGPNKVGQAFDDDGDGTEDTNPMTFAIKAASAIVGRLWASFGQSVLADLFGDYSVKLLLSELVYMIGLKRRSEFNDPKHDERIEAIKKELADIGSGAVRLHAEPDVATNQRLKSRGNFTSPRVAHLFAPTRQTPNGGGGI